ncbi:site-specific integrase [Actinopolymorpha alba]|uniref:site-specific integrase n=1 Tax=Actinopolymorpha alba TaxID=533267 RepID=UPI00037A3B04|nr:site-specific integrase [Actinopolymorpha alba]
MEKVPNEQVGADRGAWQTGDATTFLRFVREDRLYAAWLLSLFGMQRGEVLGLRWSDVDLTGDQASARRMDGPSLMVRHTRVTVAGEVINSAPKTKASRRTLDLPDLVVDALRALRKRQAEERLAAGVAYCNDDDLVVVDEIGRPYRPEWFSDRFSRLAGQAGVPVIPLHGARHCSASLLADLGMPDVIVAAWLGQSQITVTHGYQHAVREGLKEAGNALARALAQ